MGTGARLGAGQLTVVGMERSGNSKGNLIKTGRELPGGWAGREI